MASGWWPEKPPIKYSDNARVHLLNLYSDWEKKGRTKSPTKARDMARRMLELPNGLFAVDWYAGYTRPHALLILASLSNDNQEKAECYLRIVRDFGDQRGGTLGTDAAFYYGPLAKHYLNEIMKTLPETDPLRLSISKAVPAIAEAPVVPEIVELPKLLNREDLLKSIKSVYPHVERENGREGQVIFNLQISTDGFVQHADIAISGGEAFDKAALKLTPLMRFSPAYQRGGRPVVAKTRMRIQFNLND